MGVPFRRHLTSLHKSDTERSKTKDVQIHSRKCKLFRNNFQLYNPLISRGPTFELTAFLQTFHPFVHTKLKGGLCLI